MFCIGFAPVGWSVGNGCETGQTLGHNDYHTIVQTRLYQAVDVIKGPNGTPICAPITTNPYYLAQAPTKQAQILATTNSSCAPAIHLYEKLGFVHDAEIMRRYAARYERCDVAMRWRG